MSLYAKDLIAFILSESVLKDEKGKWLIELENEGQIRALWHNMKNRASHIFKIE